MVAIGKHLVLPRQERPARIDKIDARQVILLSDLLRPQMLLYGQRIVSAALYRGIVGDDHALDAVNPADSANDSGRGHVVLVDLPRGELPDLQEWRIVVEQQPYPVPRQQLTAHHVALAGSLAAAQHHLRTQFRQVASQRLVYREVGGKVVRIAIDLGLNEGHLPSRGFLTLPA